MPSLEPAVSRHLWDHLNALHSVSYWDPEPTEEYRALGLKGWARYYAARSAALGPVPPDVVTAVFYGFHPGLGRRALTGVWDDVTPSQVLEARDRGVDRLFTRRMGASVDQKELHETAALVLRAMGGCEPGGHPLFAAHAALPVPSEGHSALWHAATLYREYRGDAHVAVLVAEGVGPLDSLVLDAADGRLPADFLKANRGWSDDEWDIGVEALRARGLVDADGVATPQGARLRAEIEDKTDRASITPWSTLETHEIERLLEALPAVRTGAGL